VYEFDNDTAVISTGERTWTARPTGRWNIAGVPNGGYLLAVVLTAAGDAVSHPHPLTATAHYLRRTEPGVPVEISADVIREGRTFATAELRVEQGGSEKIRVLTTHGDLDRFRGPTAVSAEPPPIPPVDECEEFQPDVPGWEFPRRFRIRVPAEMTGLWRGEPSGVAELGGYTRFQDGREPDLRSLAIFADGFPPPILNVHPVGWVPTIELTVHFRARPAPGWLTMWFTTRFLVGGLLEEDGEIWDSEGRLVALSRQLAMLRA
jgi:acyl-CoA thioesterase